MATSYWTSTYYEFLTDKQAELFCLLDQAIRNLGQLSSQADDYIAYKKTGMKGAFVRISQGKNLTSMCTWPLSPLRKLTTLTICVKKITNLEKAGPALASS